MESLILSGAFSCFGAYRSQLMDVFPAYMEMVNNDRKHKATGQFSMFDTFEEETKSLNSIPLPSIKEYNKESLLHFEKEYVGIYLSGHPLDEYLHKYDDFTFTSDMIASLQVDNDEEQDESVANEVDYEEGYFDAEEQVNEEDMVKDGQQVIGGGIVTSIKKINTKTGNMAFITIEDIYGTYDVMLFSKLFAKYRDIAKEESLVTVKGKLSIRDGKSPVVIAESIVPWEKQEEEQADTYTVYLRFDTKNIDLYDKVKKIVSSYPGKSALIIKCSSQNKAFSFNTKVEVNNYLKNELIGLLGEENVIIRKQNNS